MRRTEEGIANLLAVGGHLGLPVELVLQRGLARLRCAELSADELHERVVARLQLLPDRSRDIKDTLGSDGGGKPPARSQFRLARSRTIGARVSGVERLVQLLSR